MTTFVWLPLEKNFLGKDQEEKIPFNHILLEVHSKLRK